MSTFTKWIPGKWKLLTGAGAVGAVAAGLHCGNETDKVLRVFEYALPEMKKAFLKYADAIESDAALREQLATYLSDKVTAKETSFRPLESAVLGKAVEFGRSTSHLNINAKDVHHTQRRTENPNRSDCPVAH